MLHTIDAEGRLLAVSDAWLSRLGYTREDVIGRRSTEFLTPASQEHASQVLPAFFAAGRCRDIAYQMVTKAGDTVDVLLSAILECDGEGAPLRSIAVIEDVTQRRRIERELLQEQRRLSSLIDGTGAAVWELNLQTNVLRVNDRWREALGLTPQDPPTATLESWWHWMHKDDVELARSQLDKIRSGRSERYQCEARMRTLGSGTIWVLDRGAVLSRTPDGRTEWIAGTQTDISEQKAQQEALRRSEAFLDRISTIAGIGGWELDLSTNALQWSAGTYRIYGLEPGTPPTLEGVKSHYAPEARPLIESILHRAATEREGWDLELPLIRDDGRRVWVRSISSVVSEPGQPVRLIGAIQDVTARVAERLALKTANERVALATESAGIAIWDRDLVNDRLIWDPMMYRLYDLAPGAVACSPAIFMECVHPDDRFRVEAELLAAQAGEAAFDTTFRIVWPDGSVRTMRGIARATHDEAGNTVHMVGANWDVTEAKRLASDLAQQHELLRVTLQSIGDGVITTDAHGLVGWLNPAAERMTGWRNGEARGRPAELVFQVVDVATGLPAGNELSECLTQGQKSWPTAERDLVSRDGTRFGIEDSAAPIRNDDGHIFGAVLVFRDVTEQRLIEAGRTEREQELREINTELERLARHLAKARDGANRANRAKSRFLAGMSHELRTPLNGILGYTQLLKLEGGLSVQQQARVDAMLAAGSHLLEMVNSVLDISEIEAEHVELRVVEAALREIVEACVDQIRPTAAAKRLALRIMIAPDAPDVISTDPVRLRQVLLNLLGNAVKFTPAGWIELRMRPTADHSAVRIEVVDTGPGIPPEQREHLFMEFERLDLNRSEIIEGSGLGLALSARLAALMKGRLGYDDDPDGGSVFWLELPLGMGQPRAQVGPTAGSLPPAGSPAGDDRNQSGARSARPLRILVVDDMAMNRDIAQSFLRVAGHEVECAESGVDAVAAVAAGAFDAVLMDVRMGGMDGLEATRQIRLLDGPAGNVPIIGLTAQAFAEQVEACHLAGMDGHLAKPYGPAALLEAVLSAVTQGHRGIPPEPEVVAALVESPQSDAMMDVAAPVLDGEAVARLGSFLPREAVASYLQSIAVRAETVKLQLDGWVPPDGCEALADAVHALTGSAGMFGCARLAGTGRAFERGLRQGGADPPELSAAFRAALEITLLEIRTYTDAASDS
jgi:PAS domain S-box-containing protein